MGNPLLQRRDTSRQGIRNAMAKRDDPMHIRAFLVLPFVLVAALATPQGAVADAGVAALQVGLHSRGLYAGPIDGIKGPRTAKAIRRLQVHARIAVDGVVGPQTRRAGVDLEAAFPGQPAAADR